jgi:hypothetical protein
MRGFKRTLFKMMAVLALASTVPTMACYAEEFRDEHGRAYRHERWHGEHVYQREDGHWYARRNNGWVVVEGVRFE